MEYIGLLSNIDRLLIRIELKKGELYITVL